MKKFAVGICAYNEEDLIEGCLAGIEDIPVIVTISKPWNGSHIKFDRTEERAKAMGAEVVQKDFTSERDQRNHMMTEFRNRNIDYVFIIDADEYYSKGALKMAMNWISENPEYERYNIGTCYYLWKNAEWELRPRFFNIIPMCYRSDMVFSGLRNIPTTKTAILPAHIEMYHFSYAAKDDRILNKLEHFSHANEMEPSWFERVWKNWKPGMIDLHPGKDRSYRFKEAHTFTCPEEIRERFYKRQPELRIL